MSVSKTNSYLIPFTDPNLIFSFVDIQLKMIEGVEVDSYCIKDWREIVIAKDI